VVWCFEVSMSRCCFVASLLLHHLDTKLVWVGEDCIALHWIALDCIGLHWIALDWIGLDCIGLDWIGLHWIGLMIGLIRMISM